MMKNQKGGAEMKLEIRRPYNDAQQLCLLLLASRPLFVL